MYTYHYEKEVAGIDAGQELVASFAAFQNKTRKIPGNDVIAHAAYKESLRSEIIRLRLSMCKLERTLHNLRICDLADMEERDYLRNRLSYQQLEYQRVLGRYRTLI
jgi:hypothetical protein